MKPTLISLLKSIGGAIPDGQRVYKVVSNIDAGNTDCYVISNSPGNAALEACIVETVKPKDIQSAALAALAETAKGQA